MQQIDLRLYIHFIFTSRLLSYLFFASISYILHLHLTILCICYLHTAQSSIHHLHTFYIYILHILCFSLVYFIHILHSVIHTSISYTYTLSLPSHIPYKNSMYATHLFYVNISICPIYSEHTSYTYIYTYIFCLHLYILRIHLLHLILTHCMHTFYSCDLLI